MNFTLKLVYLYKLTKKKSTCIYCCYLLSYQDLRKKKIDSSRICSSVYIISIITEKKEKTCVHA